MSALFNLYAEDDDGHEASTAKNGQKQAQNCPNNGQKQDYSDNSGEKISQSEKIKPELAEALQLQLKQTPEDYRKKVDNHIKSLGFATIYDIPASMFDIAMSAAIKNMAVTDAPK